MSNLVQIAGMIPAEYRKEILETNMIKNAVAVANDPSMQYLLTIWRNYVDPNVPADCGLCLGTLLNNYRQLLPFMIDLEKGEILLNEI